MRSRKTDAQARRARLLPMRNCLKGTAEDRAGVTTEPKFSPKPGLFDANIALTLRCKTPGATMHFTVDGSDPVARSPVYLAPIIVRGSELTIKSFASVTGRNDSA